MDRKNLLEAIEESVRFTERARVLLAITKLSKCDCLYNNPKEQGAVRRASMDLTRSLAKLRNG